MSQNNDELNEFKIEAAELFETAEQSLLALEQGGDFKTNFDKIFRVFHNLKGASGMLGLDSLGHHMHQLENLLNSNKENQNLTKDQIDTFLKGVDKARKLLGLEDGGAIEGNSNTETNVDLPNLQVTDQVAEQPAEQNAEQPAVQVIDQSIIQPTEQPILGPAVQEFLAEAFEILQRADQVAEKFVKDGATDSDVDSLYRDIHTLKGGAHLFHFNELGDLNHALEYVLDLLRDHRLMVSPPLIEAFFASFDLSEQLLRKISGQTKGDLSEKVRKSIEYLELFIAGQMKNPNPAEGNIFNKEEITPMKIEPIIAPESQNKQSAGSQDAEKESGSTVRVPVLLLDKLMTLMGEMVLVRNQVTQYSSQTEDQEFHNLSKRLSVITSEIQGEMMKTRMQPIGNVLSKFSRLTRELAKSLGKKIDLHISGAETELDKTLLEAVKDPLTHIVRNSCDHGIESIQERVQTGKSETGTIKINSFHEGGQVIIEITDDGKGLHRDKLIKKAIEKGLINEDKVPAMSDREIVNLIFAPGFSTASKITNVSGRGVGMDVVKTNISKIGGAVEIESEAGKGATIRLKIPLTLAIVPAMIVGCDKKSFAIPQINLVELVRVENNSTSSKIEFIQGHPVYRLRGNILPLVNIRKILNLEGTKSSADAVTNIVVLRAEDYSFGLIVDEIQDTADIVVKPLAQFLKSINIFSGATVMGDGSIALILDIGGIVKSHLDSNRESVRSDSFLDSSHKMSDDLQDFLLLKVNSPSKHGILLGYVHRLEEFPAASIEISGHKRLIRYRNSILPLISLNKSLELDDSKNQIQPDIVSVIVIEKAGSLYGIEVNEILDIMSTSAPMETSLTSALGIVGNLVTEKEIVVVIDPYKIIQKAMGLKESNVRELNGNMKTRAIKEIKQILYVEDAAFFRRHVAAVLEGAGFHITMAKNGKEALELLEQSPREMFDLVLSDIEMPIMNGFDLARKIRQDSKWSDVPLIALSTRSDQKHIDEGIKAGFNSYLEKINTDDLIKSLSGVPKDHVA